MRGLSTRAASRTQRRAYGHRVDYFVNTEYIDLERRLDLISVGLISAEGREFYAISTEFDPAPANSFVRSVVLPLLEGHDHPAWMSRAQIRSALIRFIGDDAPTFWSWGSAPWDWMGIAQLFGLDERVPDRWRYTAYEVSMLAEAAGLALNPVDASLPQPPGNVHHALADARWARDLHTTLTRSAGESVLPGPSRQGSPMIVDFVIDAEFIETEREIDLVSLAVVADDGREFYAVSDEHDPVPANEFVRNMVLPQLEPAGHPAWMSRAAIRQNLVRLVGDAIPRFWSWGGAPYDWLVIAHLFEVAERVPDGWRYTAYDITQLAEQCGYQVDPLDARLPQPPPNAHHALADARWAQQVLAALTVGPRLI